MGSKRNGQNLTAMEARFVVNVLKGQKQKDAAANAGYSKKTASQNASRLIRKKEVVAALQKSTESTLQLAEVDSSEVIKAISRIGNADIRELFDQNWKLLPPDRLSDNIAKCISSVKVTQNIMSGEVTYEYRLDSRIKALEILANIARLIKDGPNGADAVRTIADLVKLSAGLGAKAQQNKTRILEQINQGV